LPNFISIGFEMTEPKALNFLNNTWDVSLIIGQICWCRKISLIQLSLVLLLLLLLLVLAA